MTKALSDIIFSLGSTAKLGLLLLSPCAIFKRGHEDRESTYKLVYWLDKTDPITHYPFVESKRS